MTTKEQAEKEWHDKAMGSFVQPHEYRNGRNDFKSALREDIEKEKQDYIRIRDGWKKGTNQYEAYDLVVRIQDNHLKLLDTVTPKK